MIRRFDSVRPLPSDRTLSREWRADGDRTRCSSPSSAAQTPPHLSALTSASLFFRSIDLDWIGLDGLREKERREQQEQSKCTSFPNGPDLIEGDFIVNQYVSVHLITLFQNVLLQQSFHLFQSVAGHTRKIRLSYSFEKHMGHRKTLRKTHKKKGIRCYGKGEPVLSERKDDC